MTILTTTQQFGEDNQNQIADPNSSSLSAALQYLSPLHHQKPQLEICDIHMSIEKYEKIFVFNTMLLVIVQITTPI